MARPREFDTDEALDRAMHLFWTKGYHDSSIRDLVDHTGVNYYGLYAVFGSKHGLLLAALDRYRQTVTAEFAAALAAAEPTRAGLLGAFDRLFDLLESGGDQAGCLMCNTAAELAPHDTEVAARIRAHLGWLTELFGTWLDRAARMGGLRAAPSRPDLAAHLAANVYAASLLLRAGLDRAAVRRQLEAGLHAIT